jgi:hypothetical protein
MTTQRQPPRSKVLSFTPGALLTYDRLDQFPTHSLTVCCWFAWVEPDRIDEDSSYATDRSTATLVNYGEDPEGLSNAYRLMISSPANLRVWWSNGSLGPTGVSIADGDWHHLAVTLEPQGADRYKIQVIKDGEPAAEAAILHEGNHLQAGRQLVLGQRYAGDANDQFLGDMSEFTLWDHVRSIEDIRRDMSRKLNGNEQGLRLYWGLDETPPKASHGSLRFIDVEGEDPFK